jgi:hypothetical protein
MQNQMSELTDGSTAISGSVLAPRLDSAPREALPAAAELDPMNRRGETCQAVAPQLLAGAD